MTDYISRDEAIAFFSPPKGVTYPNGINVNPEALVETLKNIPAADVVEVKRGKWIDTNPSVPDWSNKKDGMSYYCSACLHPAGKYKHRTYKFCPWCGAKMEVEQT